MAVTRNLVYQNIRCDNYFPRWGEPEENITHAIFECQPALQVWSLSTTPSNLDTLHMDYFCLEENIILESELDMDPNPR